jgi:hypothetical protein
MNITLTREEAQQVLDALIWTTGSDDFSETGKARSGAVKLLFPAIETLCARLAQPEREWQGLTDEEIKSLLWETRVDNLKFARVIEKLLREKNAS